MKTKILLAMMLLFIGAAYMNFSASGSSYYGNAVIEAYGLDTVAGSSSVLRTSRVKPGLVVNFEITKPNGELVKFDGKTDINGVAMVDLSDYYTRLAGKYSILASVESGGYYSSENSFQVYPAKISASKSEIFPKDQVIRSASESSLITVKLFDDFNNPISGHVVKLISSSETDSIQFFREIQITDQNGEISFQTKSNSQGIISYSAYDVTADVILNSRAKVVYFESGAEVFQNKSMVKYASFGNASGPVDHFEIEFPDENVTQVYTNQSTDFKIGAYDSKNQPVNNYSGKIRFSVDGSNSNYAVLPEDYTFTTQDQGSHVFSLAFNFKQPGSYKLRVTDLSNPSIFAEKIIEVKEIAASNNNPSDKTNISILNPSSGTYSSNSQVISGIADPAAKVKIFDNDKMIASVNADLNGKFSFTSGLLTDGNHKIHAAMVNEIGTVISASNEIELIIDTKPAHVSQIVIEPEGAVDPGTTIKIKLFPEESLTQAKLVVAGNVFDLVKTTDGYYETSFSAPIDFGEYKLNFTLVDELGNETKSSDKIIKVGGLNLGDKNKPGKVSGTLATSGNGRVTLNWIAPKQGASAIKNYRVFYGFSPNQLTQAIDTFTNATTWYIPNLKNGTEYYFAIAAVDVKGNISEGFEKIVNATPNSPVVDVLPPEIVNGSGGSEAIKDMEEDVSKTGPEIVWLLVLSMLGGSAYALRSSRL